MFMDIEKILGYVLFENDYYIFSFENYVITLIPPRHEDLVTYKINNSVLSTKKKIKKGFVEDIILEGMSFDGKYVAFCVQDVSSLERKVKWVYKGSTELSELKIDGISFISQELNYFYDVKKYITDDFNLENEGDYTYSLNIKRQEPEKLGDFTFNGIKIDIIGNMVWKKNYDVSNNLEIWSKIHLEFKKQNYDFYKIYDLVILQKEVLNFLTYRSNNTFDAIEIYKLNEDNKKEPIGRFYISDNCSKETNYKDVKHIITADNIKNIGKIYKMINERKIYEHYYSDSYTKRSIYTPSRMLGIIIAFERLMSWKYNKEDLKDKSYFDALEVMKNFILDNEKEISNAIAIKKREFKKIAKFAFIPRIPLNDYIKKVYEEYKVVKSLKENIYTSWEKMSIIADRIAKFRNNMAHGKIDWDFTEKNVDDVKFMEILVYMLILKELELNDEDVVTKIALLFEIRPFLI